MSGLMKPFHKSGSGQSAGFTLTEMVIVLLIVGLLLAGVLTPLATQVQLRRQAETQKTLETIKEALIGYSAANGRLPCPAWSNGSESTGSGGGCDHYFDGFVPGATLGLSPVDQDGFVLDGWNHRIRYAVAKNTNIICTQLDAYTKTDGMKNCGIGNLTPALHVCGAAPALPASCSPASTLANNVPAVIFSTGPNETAGTGSADDSYNINAASHQNTQSDAAYVSRGHTAASTPAGEFDDTVVWISANVLYNRMLTAGRLP
jgi:prepilin-type N-terminal cleavage/methylation domain-containing protein